ncbi:MAG: OmpA family protein [Pseudomonadota bacterium]
MRPFIIALVMLFTVGTFFHALRFQSRTIEADVQARAEAAVLDAGGAAIDVSTDGRHVTLSGLVETKAQETAFLDSVDATFGALGPIDGLSLNQQPNFLTVTKTAQGLVLEGTVGTDAEKIALLDAANSVTDGTVEDALQITGRKSDLQAPALSGIAQLGLMSVGNLTLGEAGYSASGVAQDTDSAKLIGTALSGQQGWSNFVQAPADTLELELLQANLTSKTEEFEALEADSLAQAVSLQSRIDRTQAELDVVIDQNARLKAQVESKDAELTVLSENLADGKRALDEAQKQIASLETDLSGQKGRFAAASARLAILEGRVSKLDTDLLDQAEATAAAKAQLSAKEEEFSKMQSDLDAEVARLTEDLSSGQAALALAQTTNNGLFDELTKRTTERNLFLDERDAALALQAKTSGRLERVSDIAKRRTGQVAAATAAASAMEATKDAEIQSLSASADGLFAELQVRTKERDTALADAAKLKEDLAKAEGTLSARFEAMVKSGARIDALQDAIASQTTDIENLDAKLSARNGRITALLRDGQADRSAIEQAALAESKSLKADLAGLKADLGTASAQNDGLFSELQKRTGERNVALADAARLSDDLKESETALSARFDAMVKSGARIDGLQDVIAEQTTEIDELEAKLSVRNSRIMALLRDGQTDRATSQNDRQSLQALLESRTSERDAALSDLSASRSALDEANSASDGLFAALQTRTTERNVASDTAARLATEVAEKEAALEDRFVAMAKSGVRIDALQDVIGSQTSSIEDLETSLAARNTRVTELLRQTAELNSRRQSENASVEADLAAAQNARDAQAAAAKRSEERAQVAGSELAALRAMIESQAGTIERLEWQSGEQADLSAQCVERVTTVLEDTQVTFQTGTANVRRAALPVLERVTGIVLACAGDNVVVQIAGHTDSQGSASDNQALSEARAETIRRFMIERGALPDGLTAVGFGETQPIASNATSSGRAANRRISFEWQAR